LTLTLKLIEASDTIGQLDLIVDDTKMSSWRDLLRKCRHYAESNDLELIVIDDLQHIMEGECSSAEEKEQAYTGAIKKIKEFALMFNVPVVILSQLPEAVDERTEHRPVISDLNEYGDLMQLVDKIMFLYRDDFYNNDDYSSGITEIEVIKQPSGVTGTIKLLWSPTIGKYFNY
jgi:replicative DNA helicase